MKIKAIVILALVVAALAVGIVLANNSDAIFFDSMPWITVAAAGAGL